MMTYPLNQQREALATGKKAVSVRRRSLERELKQKATHLGLPTGKSLFPERKLSPSYGDPTAVDDRPFARI
jgi:hypothetical protein